MVVVEEILEILIETKLDHGLLIESFLDVLVSLEVEVATDEIS